MRDEHRLGLRMSGKERARCLNALGLELDAMHQRGACLHHLERNEPLGTTQIQNARTRGFGPNDLKAAKLPREIDVSFLNTFDLEPAVRPALFHRLLQTNLRSAR